MWPPVRCLPWWMGRSRCCQGRPRFTAPCCSPSSFCSGSSSSSPPRRWRIRGSRAATRRSSDCLLGRVRSSWRPLSSGPMRWTLPSSSTSTAMPTRSGGVPPAWETTSRAFTAWGSSRSSIQGTAWPARERLRRRASIRRPRPCCCTWRGTSLFRGPRRCSSASPSAVQSRWRWPGGASGAGSCSWPRSLARWGSPARCIPS
mmetsp:Transcript_115240/g.358873  ORF Transcript_115240/g.358873 Transcript_115240/m.358873 type:complete len:202 (-) Transcript_115240:340-945(-)